MTPFSKIVWRTFDVKNLVWKDGAFEGEYEDRMKRKEKKRVVVN